MSIQEQADRVLRESYRTRNRAEVAVIEFGRRPYNPRRRMAPLNDRYDTASLWLSLVFILSVCVSLGYTYGRALLWLGRLVQR